MANDLISGCPQCGLIGCKCSDVADTFDASLCKKCKCQPCECEGKPLARAVAGVCSVCRRSTGLCICTSHHGVKQVLDVSVRERAAMPPPGQRTEQAMTVLVNEAMNLYYNRDASGLAAWIRRYLR